MLRKLAAAGLVMGLVVGVLVTDAAAARGPKPTITATGDVSCGGGGRYKAKSYLVGGQVHAAVAGKLNITCNGSTGNPAVTLKKSKVSAIMSGQVGCGNNATWRFNITWRATGGYVNPTTVTYTNSTTTPSGWTAPGPGGTATVTGSYAGTASFAVINGPSSICSSVTKKQNGQLSFTMVL